MYNWLWKIKLFLSILEKSLPENHASSYLLILKPTLIITLTYYEMRPSFTCFTEIFWWIQNASHFPKWNSGFNDGNNGLKPFKNVAKFGVEVNAKKWSFLISDHFFFKNRKPNSLKNMEKSINLPNFLLIRWSTVDEI